MFFDPPERIDVMRRMVLADTLEKRQEQLDQLFVFQKDDMLGMFKAMDGLPVTIRLLDPPLHEFLPHDDHAMEHLGDLDEVKKRCQELQEVNPMLGFRGCRLTVIYPEITVMQVKAIMTAACEAAKSGAKPIVEIMIPVVALGSEIEHILPIVKATANEVLATQGLSIPFKAGTMIELPRACSCADDIAKAGAEFFSFGSNDLTQTVFGKLRINLFCRICTLEADCMLH
jgi:pyruvate,orthophosphate dikinase